MTQPAQTPGMSDSWRDYARHCMVYMAAIKAKADDGLWHLHHGDPGGVELADELYEHWLSTFTQEAPSCD